MTKDEKWLLGLSIFAVIVCASSGVFMIAEKSFGFAVLDFLFVATNVSMVVCILRSRKHDKR